jgi:hypothetical protein
MRSEEEESEERRVKREVNKKSVLGLELKDEQKTGLKVWRIKLLFCGIFHCNILPGPNPSPTSCAK